MVRLLASLTLSVLGNAVGLLAAAFLLDGFSMSLEGFIISVLVFTAAQAILSPLVLKMAIQYLPVLRGGIALATTLVALVVASMLTSSLQISGLSTWIIAPLIIWVVTIVAGILLPMVIFKEVLAARSGSNNNSQS